MWPSVWYLGTIVVVQRPRSTGTYGIVDGEMDNDSELVSRLEAHQECKDSAFPASNGEDEERPFVIPASPRLASICCE